MLCDADLSQDTGGLIQLPEKVAEDGVVKGAAGER